MEHTSKAGDAWSRPPSAGVWPHTKPVWTMGAVVVATMSGIAFAGYRYATAWTPLQRAAFPEYVRTRILGALGVGGVRPLLLDVVDTRAVHQLLGTPAVIACAALVIGLLIAVPRDVRRLRESRQGRRLRGPQFVSEARFGRRMRGDGIGFLQRGGSWIRIPRGLESSHMLIMGDSGTGKSALIRQLLMQLEARGETAIVYDPALEYTGQFYREERGDVILNPLDVRSPYWTPGDEWRQEAETLTLATSLFPERHQDNTFFTEAPRRIFAHLLTLRPTPEDLASWLCHEQEMDQLLARTAYATMIDARGPAQRSGVLASLNMVADTLKLLPPESEAPSRWSASAWADQWPHGWLFLTSTPETRTRLVPLISLWLDLLVLRLMNHGHPRKHPTWFVLDELASLQRLPQLHTAITENRKSNNPVVLGFQGRSQLETRYGHEAEAMLSQPATKIFLRTSEPRAARWVAETIGEIETERLRESRTEGRGGHRQLGLERHIEPLIMASEISGLAALHGFLKLGNLVVRMQTEFVRLPSRADALVERTAPDARPADSHILPAASVGTTRKARDHDALRCDLAIRQSPVHEVEVFK